MTQGKRAEALDWFRQAVLLAPDSAAALRDLGRCLAEDGRPGEATAPLMAALERAPKDAETVRALGAVAQMVATRQGGVDLPRLPSVHALLEVLDNDRLDHGHFAMLCIAALRAMPGLASALAALAREGLDAAVTRLLGESAGMLRDPLLIHYLARTVNLDPDLERLLTGLRRRVLSDGLYRRNGPPPAFLAAMARQCRNNEYVWYEDEAETEAVAALAEDLAARIAANRKVGAEVSAYALYRPVETLPGAQSLGRRTPVTDAEARRLAAEALKTAAEERRLEREIPTMTPLSGAISAAVARQYEENPYPRWLSLTIPSPQWDREVDVLIAGCGTGKQAVTAGFAYGARARILAIDLSRASLAYAARMARHYGLANLRFAQADILGLEGLERSFDVIECVGVLHHMADPLEGWRVLASRLKPGGLMRIGLYSERARQPIVAGRAAIAERGIPPTEAGIRRFRRDVLAGTVPLGVLAAASSDFFALSDTRDLLFHVMEHRFTIPRIAECLATLGLEFGEFSLPRADADRLLAEVGGEPGDLEAWDEIERRHPQLFRGMYQFTCRKPEMRR
ncbi:MAG: methyltransferase domain-containing protein [Magnetospirillum sp.]|nr:methyltransferase domain-containing protein [Magnetospirillum sp.]